MVEVQHVTKRYGSFTAVDDISFSVERGEILGFLGPNGAGKTTTMRILTGYLPATDGRARVAGFDVFEQPLEAKRLIKMHLAFIDEHEHLVDIHDVAFLCFRETVDEELVPLLHGELTSLGLYGRLHFLKKK